VRIHNYDDAATATITNLAGKFEDYYDLGDQIILEVEAMTEMATSSSLDKRVAIFIIGI